MIKKRAQAGVEFLLVFSILTLFAIAFLLMVSSNTNQGRLKDDQENTEDMASYLQQELITASKVESGYNRSLMLYEKIGGKEYNVMISQYSLYVNTSKAFSVRGIPLVSGNFQTNSINTILKNDTSPYIFINP
jgi:hypothetical protein